MFEKVQVKFNGEMWSFNLSDLDMANASDPSDTELFGAVSQALNVTPDMFTGFVVDRTHEPILNIRPHAVHA